MPTLREDRKNPHRKLLVNESYREKRGYISDDTFLVKGKRIFDPETTSLNYTEFFVGIFSNYYADRMITEYLGKIGIITSDECFRLKEISYKNMSSLVYEVLDPESNSPTSEDWDRADEYFMGIVCPTAAYNADTIFQINKPRIDHAKRECKICGKPFIATNRKALYCHACRKKADVLNVKKYRQSHAPAPLEKVCEYCQKTFTPKRTTGRFCSDKCRVYASRQK